MFLVHISVPLLVLITFRQMSAPLEVLGKKVKMADFNMAAF